MKQKTKPKNSTRMLVGAAIFLTLYILGSVIFGAVLARNHATVIPASGTYGYSFVGD
jgi:hypothetical protein